MAEQPSNHTATSVVCGRSSKESPILIDIIVDAMVVNRRIVGRQYGGL
jgi:hypothetical protein